MENIINIVLGLSMIYSWIHLLFIQHSTKYSDRTQYEKIVTWFAIATIALYVIGTVSQ